MDTSTSHPLTSTAGAAAENHALRSLHAQVARLERRLAWREKQLDGLLVRRHSGAAPAVNAAPATTAPGSEPVSRVREAYPAMVGRLREVVGKTIPAGANVMVVSRGDEELLELGARNAWHFPQTETGIYAGHHPADSSAAIRHLEELRARGGQFLILPATAFWWLDHYADFHRHLQKVYALVANEDQTCRVFDVREGKVPSRAAGDGGKAGQYASLVRQVQRMVESLLPADAKVAVISRGDPALLKLGKRQASHLPVDVSGRYAGHHPADGPEAVAQVKAARAAGAQFLVIPRTAMWWLEYYQELDHYLHAHARLVQNQPHAGIIFEL